MAATDWPAVAAVYAEGIASGNATFETEVPSWRDFDSSRSPIGRLVAEDDIGPAGWIAASPVSPRPCYRGVVEHSVYVAGRCRGQGIGSRLLGAFLRVADADGIWTVQTSIFPENDATRRLHERHGFREVGRRERIAQLDGRWRDTLLLERRIT
jgi:phosphinothricin acetyltransferase